MVRRRLLTMAVVTSIVSIILVACGSGAAPAPATAQPASPPPPPPAATPTAPAVPGGSGSSGASTGGTQFEVTLADPAGSGSYEFKPDNLTFKVGETVTFTFNAQTEFHTFTVDDLGIDEPVDGGSSSTLTFTFDKAGTFELICIPHEALGMVGTITVQ